MKFIILITSMCCLFQTLPMCGQDSTTEIMEEDEQRQTKDPSIISWKPYTLEFSGTNFGYGITVEKAATKKLAIRAIGYSSFKFKDIDYQFGFGCLYDLIKIKGISIRTGIELGGETRPGSSLFSRKDISPIISLPSLLQIQLEEKISINVGLRNAIKRKGGFIPTFSFVSLDSYQVGIRFLID